MRMLSSGFPETSELPNLYGFVFEPLLSLRRFLWSLAFLVVPKMVPSSKGPKNLKRQMTMKWVVMAAHTCCGS
eukprot:5855051-Prorocentrum_lima.AAC.1